VVGVHGGIMSVSRPSVAPFTSLVVNGDFEQGALPAGWTYESGSQIVSNTAKSPTRSFFVDYPNSSWARYTTTSVLTVGSFYSLSFWHRGNGPLEVQFYLGTARYDSFTTNAGTTWTRHEVLNKQCVANGNLEIYFGGGEFFTFNLDDIVVTPGATAP